MSAEQRRLLEQTLVENEARLQAQLKQVRGKASSPPAVHSDSDHKLKPGRRYCPINCVVLSTVTSPRTCSTIQH